jgi:hypothetical protein
MSIQLLRYCLAEIFVCRALAIVRRHLKQGRREDEAALVTFHVARCVSVKIDINMCLLTIDLTCKIMKSGD